MATDRVCELWRDREKGDVYLVEISQGRVVAADGPLAEHELAEESLAMRRAAQGRSPAFTAEAANLERRRGEFARERLEV